MGGHYQRINGGNHVLTPRARYILAYLVDHVEIISIQPGYWVRLLDGGVEIPQDDAAQTRIGRYACATSVPALRETAWARAGAAVPPNH